MEGFSLACSYSAHNSAVKCIVFNPNNNYFASLDDRQIRLWTNEGGVKEIGKLDAPVGKKGYFTRIVYANLYNVYLVTCLDMNMRIYDCNLVLLQTVSFPSRPITALVFNNKKSEIITGGVDGIRVWSLSCSSVSGENRNRLSTKILQFTVLQKMQFDENSWLNCMVFHESKQILYAVIANKIASLDCTSLKYTTLTTLENIVSVSCCAYLEHLQYLLTATNENEIKVWSLTSSTYCLFTLTGHTATVTGIIGHPDSSLCTSCSHDGTVRVWNLHAHSQVSRLETRYPCNAFVEYKKSRDKSTDYRAILSTNKSLDIYTIGQKTVAFAPNLPDIVSISRVINNCTEPLALSMFTSETPAIESGIMCVFEDSSIRLLNEKGEITCIVVPDLTETTLEVILVKKILHILGSSGRVYMYDTAGVRIKYWSSELCSSRSNAKRTCMIHAQIPDMIEKVALEKENVVEAAKAKKKSRGLSLKTFVSDQFFVFGTNTGDYGFVNEDCGTTPVLYSVSSLASVEKLVYEPLNKLLLIYCSDFSFNVIKIPTMKIESTIFLGKRVSSICAYNFSAFIGYCDGSSDIVRLNSFERVKCEFEHTASITSCVVSNGIFASCGMDGCVKLRDENGTLYKELQTGDPIRAMNFLLPNDIVIALRNEVSSIPISSLKNPQEYSRIDNKSTILNSNYNYFTTEEETISNLLNDDDKQLLSRIEEIRKNPDSLISPQDFRLGESWRYIERKADYWETPRIFKNGIMVRNHLDKQIDVTVAPKLINDPLTNDDELETPLSDCYDDVTIIRKVKPSESSVPATAPMRPISALPQSNQKYVKKNMPNRPAHKFQWSSAQIVQAQRDIIENNGHEFCIEGEKAKNSSLASNYNLPNITAKGKAFVPLLRLSTLIAEDFNMSDFINSPSTLPVPKGKLCTSRAIHSQVESTSKFSSPPSPSGTLPRILLEAKKQKSDYLKSPLVSRRSFNSSRENSSISRSIESEMKQRSEFAQKVLATDKTLNISSREINMIASFVGKKVAIQNKSYNPGTSFSKR